MALLPIMVFYALFFCLAAEQGTQDCNFSCDWDVDHSLVTCEGKNVSRIPQDLPLNTTKL